MKKNYEPKKKESQNWKEFVAILEKDLDQLNKDRAAGKIKSLTAVEVVCTQEDMDKANSWIRRNRKKSNHNEYGR